MLFKDNGESIMFNLKDMTEEERRMLTELIKKNGGEITDGCEYIYTNPKMYKKHGEEIAVDVKHIYDSICIKRFLDLDNYIIGGEKFRSQITERFINWGKRFNCSTHANPKPWETQVLIKGNRNTTFSAENNHVTTDRANEGQLRVKILSTEKIDDTQFSYSIYNQDETQSQQLIDRDKNIEFSQGIGNTRVSDSIYNPDDTRSQSINKETKIYLINDAIEVPSASDRPNELCSCEITRACETAASSNSNVKTNQDVCYIKEEPCFITETAPNNGIDISNVPSTSSETRAESVPHESPANIEIVSEIMRKFPPRNKSPKLRSSNSQRVSVTPERIMPFDSKKGKLRTGLRCKNMRKQTAATSNGSDTANLLYNLVRRAKPTKDTTKKTPGDADNSIVISDGETDCDEVTLEKRKNKRQKKITEFESENDSEKKYSPLIDSDSTSGSDSPKSQEQKVRFAKRNFSKESSNDRTAMVTLSKSGELCDRLSSSNDDSDLKIIDSPSCPKQSQPNRSKPKIKTTFHFKTRNFMSWERKEMVKYLIENKCISGAKGNSVWRQMINDGNLKHRTFQSLQNHFRKYIFPNIHRYPMDAKSRAEFDRLPRR